MRRILHAFILLGLLALPLSPAGAADSRTLVDISEASVSEVAAEQLVAANKARRYLFIQNIGSTYVWINYGGTAAVATAGSFRLAPFDSLTFEGDTLTRDAISIISQTSAGTVTAYEG